MQPLVSLVVPVFNGLSYLPALTNSLLAQTHPNLEIVFSEGGSTDGSLDFLRELDDPRVRLIEQPRGTSAAENWTSASEAASGEFTKLICQDDLLYPTAIEEQVHDLVAHQDAVMAIAARDIVDASGRAIFKQRGLAGLNGDYLSGQQVMHTCYRQGTNVIGEPLAVLFRTDVLKEALPWQDDNPLMLDLSMYAKVAQRGGVVIRRNSLGAFRVSNASWSTRLAREQLEQTARWQNEYRAANSEGISRADQTRALVGRHLQTNLRRLAYAILSARGRLDA